MNALTRLITVIAIATLELVALRHNVDGVALAAGFAALGAIAGYTAAKKD